MERGLHTALTRGQATGVRQTALTAALARQAAQR